MPNRCSWATTPLLISYHDEEWGVPVHDDTRLFEFLVLEGAQAGLSWETILRKRDNYRAAFDHFDPAKVAKYNQRKIAALMNDAGIIRNNLKINSAVTNANAFLQVKSEFGSFDEYVWRFVNGKPLRRKPGQSIVARTEVSDALSKDLIKRGFKFVGSTITIRSVFGIERLRRVFTQRRKAAKNKAQLAFLGALCAFA